MRTWAGKAYVHEQSWDSHLLQLFVGVAARQSQFLTSFFESLNIFVPLEVCWGLDAEDFEAF